MDPNDQHAPLEKEKMDQKQAEHVKSNVHSKESPGHATEDEEKYPPFKVVLPVVLALYLAIFLISVVSISGSLRCLAAPYSHH